MSILSICFRGEIRKIFIWIFLFSGAMRNALCAGRSGQTLLTYSKLITSFNHSWLWLFWNSTDSLKYKQSSKLTVASSKFATWKFSLLPDQIVGSKKLLPGIVPWTLSSLSAVNVFSANKICRFPLPLGVWEGLRFVIVALPGLFSYLFWHFIWLVCQADNAHVKSKKVREKSRECHNHKPQPFPDPKRKRKLTNLNKHKPNKRTKITKISSLFPKPYFCWNKKNTLKMLSA